MKTRVYEGFPVFHMLATTEFRLGWTQLYARCPWRTTFVHPDFVEAWFRTRDVRPVLVTSLDQGWVTGIVALAETNGRLMFAGGNDVPAHGWLAEPLRGSFVLESHLREVTRGSELSMRLAGAPTDWLGDARPLGRLASSSTESRRAIRLDPERAARALDKKRNVSQLPFLKELGPLELFDGRDFATYVDWADHKRHACGLSPSPQRARVELYQRLTAPHFVGSILRAGDHVLSAMLLYVDGDRAWLELSAENPEHEKHSPLLVHLFLLEERLLEQDVHSLDVTADDGYLHLLADQSPEITRAELLFTRRARMTRAAKGAAQAAISRAQRLIG